MGAKLKYSLHVFMCVLGNGCSILLKNTYVSGKFYWSSCPEIEVDHIAQNVLKDVETNH